mmetsp:Transcript_32313/g.80086  ORF Transcript_32313/g.80086 Transcript_32313/m.80086 type:complete len:148 (-) Transcript_32313:405-848(-)
MTIAKLNGWVLTRLRSACEKRKRGMLHFRTAEQEARAALVAQARARGTARRANGGSALRQQLAEAQEKMRSMAQALLEARRVGQEVANALTEAKARSLHPKVCAGSPLPAEHAPRIRDIDRAAGGGREGAGDSAGRATGRATGGLSC